MQRRERFGGLPLPQHADRAHSQSVSDFLRVLRRRRWIVLTTLLFVPLVAVLLSLQQQKLYEASAQVLINRQNLANLLTGTTDLAALQEADRVARTQAELARVPTVAKRALEAAELRRSPTDLLDHSSVSAQQNTDILDFTVTDPLPARAIRLVTAYVRAFVVYRKQLDTAALDKARAELRAEIDKLADEGRQAAPIYATLVEKDQELATMQALQTSNLSVVRTPTDATQVQPKPVRTGVMGLVLGLALGIGLVLLWEALDTRVRSAEEIAERLRLPLLARLPQPPRALRRDDRLVMLAEPRGTQAEAFRMLRTNLSFMRLGHEVRTIMVTSAVEQEGKSTTAANLAIALARAGQQVCLVDLDLRRPYLHRFFNLRNPLGVTRVAIGEVRLEEALESVPLVEVAKRRRSMPEPVLPGGGLRVLAAGAVPPNAGEFVGSEALAHILLELRSRFDTVLIDSPPVLQVGDAATLSSHVDGLVVVSRLGIARRPMLNELRRVLETVPARGLGFVLAGSEEEEGYGYGYGGYYAGAYPAHPESEARTA